MKLGAFKIGELTVMTCGTYTGEQIGVNEPFIVADVLPNTYEDISSIENWHNVGGILIGQFANFKDWKCLRNEIKLLAMSEMTDDWANFSVFSQTEKEIVSLYLLNKIPSANLVQTWGYNPTKFTELANEFDSRSTIARRQRYESGRLHVFNNLELVDAMKVVNDMTNGLYISYLNGIESLATDGYSGIIDYAGSAVGTDYENTGIKANFVNTKTGVSKQAFCDTLVGILRDGLY